MHAMPCRKADTLRWLREIAHGICKKMPNSGAATMKSRNSCLAWIWPSATPVAEWIAKPWAERSSPSSPPRSRAGAAAWDWIPHASLQKWRVEPSWRKASPEGARGSRYGCHPSTRTELTQTVSSIRQAPVRRDLFPRIPKVLVPEIPDPEVPDPEVPATRVPDTRVPI
jgi:hypothetical protein